MAIARSIGLPGSRKLYLQVESIARNRAIDADWVDLSWEMGQPVEAGPARVFQGKDFGIAPNVRADQSALLRRALEALRAGMS